MKYALILCCMLFVFFLGAGLINVLAAGAIRQRERVDSLAGKKKTRRTARLLKKKKQDTEVKTRKYLEKLADELYVAGIALRPREFVTVWLAAALGLPCLLLFFGANFIMCMAVVVIGAAAPLIIVKRKKKKRLSLFDSQLVDAVNIICSSLKAGLSFQTAMFNISEEMEPPISREFGRVYRETRMGMPIEMSFSRMVERTGSADLELICQAVVIQRQVGGNLAAVLENIAGTITDRVKMRSELKALTASGSFSGYLIGALPIFIILLLMFVNPEYIKTLFVTNGGRIMLAISVVMETIGFLLVKKIVNIKM